MGLGMGATVVAIVTSTWGKQSAIRFGFGGRLEKAANGYEANFSSSDTVVVFGAPRDLAY
jgi:hypothetical protein